MSARLRSPIGGLGGRRRFEVDMREELQQHLAAHAEDLAREGLSRREAERRARIELGSLEGLKDDLRAARGLSRMTTLVRGVMPASRLVPVVQRAVRELEPLAPVYGARNLDAVITEATAPTRDAMTLVVLLAVVALVLTAGGTYGLGAFVAAERRTEVSVWIALGASATHVFGLVLGQAVRPAIVGVLAGGLLAALLVRLVSVAAYGVAPKGSLTRGLRSLTGAWTLEHARHLQATLQRSGSGDALAFRGLSRQQKCLDQLTLAAHGHAREALVPLTLGHIGLRVEPCRERLKLRRRDLPPLNAFEQMLKQRGRKILSADLRHGRQMP
jgi:hypothetical protein